MSEKRSWLFDYAPGFKGKCRDGRTYVVIEDLGNESKIKYDDGAEVVKTKDQLDEMTTKVLGFALESISTSEKRKRAIEEQPSDDVESSFNLGQEVNVKGKGKGYILDINPNSQEVTVILDDVEKYDKDNVVMVKFLDLEESKKKKGLKKNSEINQDDKMFADAHINSEIYRALEFGDQDAKEFLERIFNLDWETILEKDKNPSEFMESEEWKKAVESFLSKFSSFKKPGADPEWDKEFEGPRGLKNGAKVVISNDDPVPQSLKGKSGVLTEKSPYYDSYLVKLDEPTQWLSEVTIAGDNLTAISRMEVGQPIVDKKGLKKVVSKMIEVDGSEIFEITSSNGDIEYVSGTTKEGEYSPIPEIKRTEILLQLSDDSVKASEEKKLNVETMGSYSFDNHDPVWIIKETEHGFILDRLE